LTITRDSDHRDDCFADEIAIDFPSVGDLVERVRDAFLGEDAERADGTATHTTEVSLSRRDATRGTVVPLEVPLRGTCRLCGGRGETWTEPCHDCRGTGDALVQHPVRLSVPAGVAHGARLRFRVNAPHAAPLRVVVRVAIRTSAA
jgi:DnaJ-class molecular chaperone